MERVDQLQGNVVDLTSWDLKEGGADVAVVVAWLKSNPAGLTRLKLEVTKVTNAVVAALHELELELAFAEGG